MKKRKILFSFICIICLSSCSLNKAEKSDFDKFEECFYLEYPNGYDPDKQWYEFHSSTVFYDNLGEKQIQEIVFLGEIDFFSDSFSGYSNEFVCKSKTTIFSESNNIEISTFDCLKNNVWYSSEKKVNLISKETNIISFGRSDISSISLSFDLIKEIFQPRLINYINSNVDTIVPFIPFNLSVENNQIIKYTVIRQSEKNNLDYINMEYYFDNNFKLTMVKRIMYEISTLANKTNYINTAYLKTTNKVTIDQLNNYNVTTNKIMPPILEGLGRGL